MQLEQYFDFVGPDSIRVAGTRVGMETIVRDYLEGASPEEIGLRYPTLSLEQVHATITYYLAHRAEVEAYVARVEAGLNEGWEEQRRGLTQFVRVLRERIERERQERRRTESDAAAVLPADESALPPRGIRRCECGGCPRRWRARRRPWLRRWAGRSPLRREDDDAGAAVPAEQRAIGEWAGELDRRSQVEGLDETIWWYRARVGKSFGRGSKFAAPPQVGVQAARA
jgi:uncharacterized protein (DUF433 family)